MWRRFANELGNRGQEDWNAKAGDKVGGYSILRKLGERGMGEVYLAEHRRIACSAAIKVLRPDGPELQRRTDRGAKDDEDRRLVPHSEVRVGGSEPGVELVVGPAVTGGPSRLRPQAPVRNGKGAMGIAASFGNLVVSSRYSASSWGSSPDVQR